MSSDNLFLKSLVTVDAGFKPAVYLPDHFNDEDHNAQLIRTYIPTSQSISFLAEVARSLNPSSDQRARMLHGTFGTGKSDMLLILCNYFSRPVDDPVMQPFYDKLRRINESQYNTIYQQRENKKPFLVVLLQANAVTPFAGFILYGLEQALKQAGLDDLMLPTRYSAAWQKLDEWQRESHHALQHFISVLRDNENLELARLMSELRGPEAGLVFPAFQRAFRAAAGTPFDIYSYARPEETYKHVAQALRERGSHSGIIVVCDEFTEVLRRLARSGDQQSAEVEVEALGVQDLANTSVASGQNQLHFVVASLEGFASAGTESTSASSAQAIEKIGGRFKSFALEIQDSAELIYGALKRLDERPVLPSRQYDELMGLARLRWQDKPKQWVAEKVVDGCFPLHPLVTYALPTINGLVAQNNRTMFQFLKDKEGLEGFLAQTILMSNYPDWNNLLTLDWLFDYFEKSIQVRRSDITDTYNHALQLLSSVKSDSTLAHRVLKVIAVCEVVAPILSPTRELLRQALNLPSSAEGELREALALLEQIEAVFPPNDADGAALGPYGLPMSGRVSPIGLRQRVIRKARDLHGNVANLQASYPAEAVEAEEYNRRRGSWRELKAYYVSMADLNSSSRLQGDLYKNPRDGLLWYVIANSETERSEAQSKARELTRQQDRLIVAVPTLPLDVLELLKNYEALQQVRTDSALDSAAKAYLQDQGRVGSGFHKALTNAISKLRDEKQWEWFREGISQPNIINRAQAQDLASKVMNTVFLSTPEHALKQHFKAEGVSSTLVSAIGEVLKGEIKVTKGSSAAVAVVLRTGMTGLGLLKSVRVEGAHETFALAEPSGAQFYSEKVWQLFKSHLSAGKSWRKLVDTLRGTPYGLYDSLIFAFTGAFFTFYADAIEVTMTTGGTKQVPALDEKALKGLVESPQNYTVKLHPLSDLERQWLQDVVRVGLGKPFDPNGGQGKTLRVRVAAVVKKWLDTQSLPHFAEKLDAKRLAALMPGSPAPIIDTVKVLLQGKRNTDEAIASALLKEIPVCLQAPENHDTWTNVTVQELVAGWGETCRLIERLPNLLEQYAIDEIAEVFGCRGQSADHIWVTITSWRRNRSILQNRVETLNTQVRTFFRLTNQPTTTIREAILDEFARTTVGINTVYHTWPTIEYLDRLVKEVQKARDEIDTQWRAVAKVEDVWHDGLASAALGRPMSGVNAEKASKYLCEWAGSIQWPHCAPALQTTDLQRLSPGLSVQVCADIGTIVKRIQYRVEDWQRDLSDALPRELGVEIWNKVNVEQAVARIGLALNHAANLDTLLRKHTLSLALRAFGQQEQGQQPADFLHAWREAHPIPSENDLGDEAQLVLSQIDSGADVETMLLFTLPRALPRVNKTYQQWDTYADLDRYIECVKEAVCAIESYEPLGCYEQRWLVGIGERALGRQLPRPPREKRRLSTAVMNQITEWLKDIRLPVFASALSVADLAELFPEAPPVVLETMHMLLSLVERSVDDPVIFLLNDLPQILALSTPVADWDDSMTAQALAELTAICEHINRLTTVTTGQLLEEISHVFGVEPSDSAGPLMVKLREWRQAYVLFANEALSPEATLLSDVLTSSTQDPHQLLLTSLPSKLTKVNKPFSCWQSWNQRFIYRQALQTAATEIAQRGKVSDATPQVRALWENVKAQILLLSRDEQRWLIKAFQEEFHA